MKAYVILEGGGVKGAALAGGLAAAENHGVEIVGLGGSSAGSIVALLAAAGFTGTEIGEELQKLDFGRLLSRSGKGRRLTILKRAALMHKQDGAIKRWLFLPFNLIAALGLVFWNWKKLGIYSGDALVDTLVDIVRKKSHNFNATVTFAKLSEYGFMPLRVIVTNITHKEPVVVDERAYPEMPVMDAIRASSGYPFAFRPTKKIVLHPNNSEQPEAALKEVEAQLVDGGLSSNLPSFLFLDEYRRTGTPTLLMDLVQQDEPVFPGNLLKFSVDLLGTALESSDQIIMGISHGTIRVPIEVAEGIDTLDFNIPEIDRRRLFLEGHSSASNYLAKHDRLQMLKTAKGLQDLLIAKHGPAEIYEPILVALIREIESLTMAESVRACILLPTDKHSLKLTYHAGFENCPDADLELERGEGAAWVIWEDNDLDIDFCDPKNDDCVNTLTPAQQAKIPEDRKSLLMFKIYADHEEGGTEYPIGILSIDSATPLKDTGWVADDQSNGVRTTLTPAIMAIVSQWLPVIPLVMRAKLI